MQLCKQEMVKEVPLNAIPNMSATSILGPDPFNDIEGNHIESQKCFIDEEPI